MCKHTHFKYSYECFTSLLTVLIVPSVRYLLPPANHTRNFWGMEQTKNIFKCENVRICENLWNPGKKKVTQIHSLSSVANVCIFSGPLSSLPSSQFLSKNFFSFQVYLFSLSSPSTFEHILFMFLSLLLICLQFLYPRKQDLLPVMIPVEVTGNNCHPMIRTEKNKNKNKKKQPDDDFSLFSLSLSLSLSLFVSLFFSFYEESSGARRKKMIEEGRKENKSKQQQQNIRQKSVITVSGHW